MEPAIIALAGSIISILTPYVSKGAEEFASKVGDAAFEKAKAILTTLKQRWSGDKEATDSLQHFEEKPERYQAVLQDILQEKLSGDQELVENLTQLVHEMGPDLEVIRENGSGKECNRCGDRGNGRFCSHRASYQSRRGCDWGKD